MRKRLFWNPATFSCKNDKYSGSITDNSVVICNEILKETKPVPAKTISTKKLQRKPI